MRVASYNVRVDAPEDGEDRWPHRRDDVAALLRAIDPDLVGLQETLASQLADLRERLPEYLLVGRSRGESRGPDEHVPLGYRHERFALADLSVRWLSETPAVPGSTSWDAAHARVATSALLHDTETDAHVGFVVTHFDHESERARVESADLVRSTVDRFDDHPVVVVGDFNCEPDSEAYRRLTEDREDARDLAPAADRADEREGPRATFTGFGGEGPDQTIDHAFVTDDVVVRRHAVRTDTRENGRYPSDHFPIVVDLEY